MERIGKLIEIGEYCGIEVAILAYASITMVAGAFQVLTTAFFTINPILGVAVGMLGVWSIGMLAGGWLQKCQQ